MTFDEWLEFYSPGAHRLFTEGEILPLRAAWDASRQYVSSAPDGYAVIMDDAPEKGRFTYVAAYTKREHADDLLKKCRGGSYRVAPIFFAPSP